MLKIETDGERIKVFFLTDLMMVLETQWTNRKEKETCDILRYFEALSLMSNKKWSLFPIRKFLKHATKLIVRQINIC